MPGKELPLRHPSGPRGQDDWGRAEKLPKNPPSGSSQSFRDRPTRAYSTKGVVVANHASHADTAVLLAALPADAQPVVGAAADYWFDVPVRRLIATSLIGVLPVRRSGDGTYAALLATHSGLSTHLPCVTKKCPLACDASGGHV